MRDLIPHSEQKRDTASFLLEVCICVEELCIRRIQDALFIEMSVFFGLQVIEYVQYLQERVNKHEGSCQGWSAEPTKLMPWVMF